MKVTMPMKQEAPADETGTNISIKEPSAKASRDLKIGSEQTMTGSQLAKFVGEWGTGDYYKDLWRRIQELGLQEKQLKVFVKDGGVLKYIKDPDTGKQLGKNGWEIPDMSETTMFQEKKKVEPQTIDMNEEKVVAPAKMRVTKKADTQEAGIPEGMAAGGEVQAPSTKQMTGAQLQREFQISKPGDVATVYDVVVENGTVKSATPNQEETQRFSRVVSEMDPGNPQGGADARNQAALQYSSSPNVGVASGAGYMGGGKVKMAEGGPMAQPEAPTAPPAEAPAVEQAEGEGNMDAPFSSYQDVAGIDPELIKQGNTLFTQIEQALSAGDQMKAQQFMDQLKQFAADVESARNDAVKSMNDSALAASYKEMASDANDLLTAFQNMMAETESPEAMAGKESMPMSETPMMA